MSKVKRFSLEERYGYQNRKVIYDKNSDNDIELNNIYPIIDLFNQLDEQIIDLEAKLAESEKQRQHLKDWLDDEILTSVDKESYYATINEYEEEVKKLKQQLEETEEERDGNYENYSICWKDNEYLKQQLKEKDKKIEYFADRVEKYNNLKEEVDVNFVDGQKYNELKQQLDEKDKEISNLNGLVRERDKQIKNLKTNKKRVIEHKNKTKISFATEQLEKVKDYFLEPHRDEEMDTDYLITKDAGEIADYLLYQIKQLKEGK